MDLEGSRQRASAMGSIRVHHPGGMKSVTGSCRSAAPTAAGHQPHPRALAIPEGSPLSFSGLRTAEKGPTEQMGSGQVGRRSSKPRGLWLTASLPPQYIVLFVAKVLMGQMQEVNDVREYDVEDSKKTTTVKKKEAGLQLPNALKEGYVGGGGSRTCTASVGQGKGCGQTARGPAATVRGSITGLEDRKAGCFGRECKTLLQVSGRALYLHAARCGVSVHLPVL